MKFTDHKRRGEHVSSVSCPISNLFVIAVIASCIDSNLSIIFCSLNSFELELTGQAKFMT